MWKSNCSSILRISLQVRARHARSGRFFELCWNHSLSHGFAQRIKELAPDCLVVAGGPNYPLEAEQRERWLREHPAYDIYTAGEGERAFTMMMDAWLPTRDKKAMWDRGQPGCHGLENGKAPLADVIPRQDNLDDSLRPTGGLPGRLPAPSEQHPPGGGGARLPLHLRLLRARVGKMDQNHSKIR
jgi:hypothetical protein